MVPLVTLFKDIVITLLYKELADTLTDECLISRRGLNIPLIASMNNVIAKGLTKISGI